MVTMEKGFKMVDRGPGHPHPGSTLAPLPQAYPETIAQGPRGNTGSTAADVGGRVLTGHMGRGAQVAPAIMSSREAG